MTAATIITLRETLEASLVVGIVLAYLHTVDQKRLTKFVWSGVAMGIILSALLAVVFHVTIGGFRGYAEELYEGIVMLAAAGLISWMLIWMLNQKHSLRSSIESEVGENVHNEHPFGIFFLVLIAVMREGIETILFLHAAYLQASTVGFQLLGGALGIVVAIAISLLFFKGMNRFGMKTVFSVSTVLLLFFAAGLVAHGIHELQEAGVIPVIIEHVWDINPTVVTEGVYPALHENGIVGGFLKALLGYNGNPNLLEVIAYVAYLSVMAVVWRSKKA